MANHEILLYEDVGGWGISSADFINQVKSAAYNPIDLRINSGGGNVFDGYAIYNALKRHAPGVNVYVDGLAASIASYVAMAGNKIVMAKNAMLMIHRPTFSASGGTSDEMRQQADLLDSIQSSIADAYSNRTGIPVEEMDKMLDEETWIDADQALAFGFVDEITPELAMAASFDSDKIDSYKNVPESIKNAVWTTAYINNLPDSAFLHVEDGGKQDGEGKTVPRSLRHFPYKDGSGKVDLPHLRNALARIPQSNLPADIKDRLTKKAQKILADNESKNTMEPNPPPNPTPLSEAPADKPKPSIFSRVSAMLKDKGDLVALVGKHKAEIEAKDKEIEGFKAQLSDALHKATEAEAKNKTYEAAEKELNETITKLESEAKSASDRAVNIVAAAGFDPNKLPAAEAADKKSAQEIKAQYDAIADPGEKTKFFRANEAALKQADAESKEDKKD